MFRVVRTLMLGGLTGKVLGIARELLSAALFGTGPIAAAYRLAQAAFLIPLHGFLSDAFGAGFTPAYSRIRANEIERSRTLFAGMHAIVLVVSVVVGLLMAIFALRWVRLLAPGFGAETAALASQMVVIMSLAMPFYALTALYASAGLAEGKPQIAATRASVQSVGLILGTLLAWYTGSALFIAAGFLLAYLALTARGLTSALSQGMRPWPRRTEWAAVRALTLPVWRSVRVLMLVPILLQVHFIIERRVASLVGADAVAALDYVRFLSDTAVLLLAVPIGLAGLGTMPQLTEARFRELAARSMRMLLYIGVPLSLALVLHAKLAVQIVFARGAFDAASVERTATILQTLAVGLWAQLIGYAGAKFLSARHRNRSLIGIYLSAVSCNVLLNVALYRTMGAAALGIASAANSLVFGLLVLKSLGLFGALRRDLITVGAIAMAYVLMWNLASGLNAPRWLPLVAFAGYWCVAVVVIPRCRAVLHELWLSMRAA
jgi:putative peptidoglycan lipid II flippase